MSKNINAKQLQKQFILNENLWKITLKLSWPAVIAMILYGGNAMLDAYFVGRYVSETALAGVSLAYPISQMSTALGILVGVGAGSVLSIAIGAKNVKIQNKLLGNVNSLILIFTVIYMIVALNFSQPLISLMGGKGEVLALGNEYFKITVYGAVFWLFGVCINMIIRAEGEMKTAAWMMGTGLVANAIFNYFFIVLMDMGVAGAAWGTNVGMLVYTIVGFGYFISGKATFNSKIFSLNWSKNISIDILRLGTSSFIMSVMILVQSFVVFNALSIFGTESDIAFYGVVFRIFQFAQTPITGLMRALQPVVGINFGAQKYERVIGAYKIFTIYAVLLTIPFWIITLISPNLILETMLTEQTITASQIIAFRIYMAILPLLSFVFMAMTFFPAVGKGKPASIIGMARQFVFYVPAMIIVPRVFGVESIYYASFFIDLLVAIWTIFWIKKEFKTLRNSDIGAQSW